MYLPISRRSGVLLACAMLAAAGAVLAPHSSAGRTKQAALPKKVALATLNCGDTITKSTTLASDLVNCAGNGLNVTGNNVVLNLNGHRVVGQGSSAGIAASGSSDTIENGTVAHFTDGVRLEGTGDRAQGLHVSQASTGIVNVADNGVVSGNFVAQNSLIGIADQDGAHTQVTNNFARDNSVDGIQILAAGAVVTGNKALSNTSTGIEGGSTTGMLISANVANGNGANGIIARGNVVLSKNTADFNTALGISASPYDTDGAGNKATGNGTLHQCANVVCS